MRYEIIRLDRRFSHRDRFEYAIKFSNSMSQGSGPLAFNNALKWFYQTYGWSAEIRSYEKMMKWITSNIQISSQPWASGLARGILTERPDHCNPIWSWTNGYDDSLRIYVATERELAFFQLANPVDQK